MLVQLERCRSLAFHHQHRFLRVSTPTVQFWIGLREAVPLPFLACQTRRRMETSNYDSTNNTTIQAAAKGNPNGRIFRRGTKQDLKKQKQQQQQQQPSQLASSIIIHAAAFSTSALPTSSRAEKVLALARQLEKHNPVAVGIPNLPKKPRHRKVQQQHQESMECTAAADQIASVAVPEANRPHQVSVISSCAPPPMTIQNNNNTMPTATTRMHDDCPINIDDNGDNANHNNTHVPLATALPAPPIQIFVKPLLVLDLNGILCFRVRRSWPGNSRDRNGKSSTTTITAKSHLPPPPPKTAASFYRPQLGPIIAMTPVIPRPNLLDFMHFVDQHFCLAIWTSAKAKTAKALVELLIPEPIRRRLLFVWAQHHCQVDSQQQLSQSFIPVAAAAAASTKTDTPDPSSVVYKKDLGHVWREFPLWNQSNTLLMDDSPDKCVAWQENAIHPPALHGKTMAACSSSSSVAIEQHNNGVEMTDEDNVARQQVFFERLVQHWRDNSSVHDWDGENVIALATNGEGHFRFLQEHAVGHMGWHT